MAQQQQQQALHAAGGNMYMGGGGMAAIGGMHQMHQRLGYPRTNNQRPPNVSVGPPDGLGNSIAGRGAQQEWRHVFMQQQQQGFQAQMRSQFNQQSHQGERDRVAGRTVMFVGRIANRLPMLETHFNSAFALASPGFPSANVRASTASFRFDTRAHKLHLHRELSAPLARISLAITR